jgi:hypothetical protein
MLIYSAERDVAERSILIKNMLEDLGESEEPVPIPNVSSRQAYFSVTITTLIRAISR